MDFLNKINASWATGENAEIECEDGRKIKIKDGVDQIFAKANTQNKDNSKEKTSDRETDNEIGSK